MNTITKTETAAAPFYVERRLRHNGAGCQYYFPKAFAAQVGFPLAPGRDHVAVAVPDGCVVLLPRSDPPTPLRIEIPAATRIDD